MCFKQNILVEVTLLPCITAVKVWGFLLDLQVILIPGVTRKICTRNFKRVLGFVLKDSLYLTC